MATAEPYLNGNSNGFHALAHSPQLDGSDNGMPPTPNPGAGPASATTPAVPFDSGALRAYLAVLLPVLLSASPEDVESVFDVDFAERSARFAGEGGPPLYVVKTKDDVEGALFCAKVDLAISLILFGGICGYSLH